MSPEKTKEENYRHFAFTSRILLFTEEKIDQEKQDIAKIVLQDITCLEERYPSV